MAKLPRLEPGPVLCHLNLRIGGWLFVTFAKQLGPDNETHGLLGVILPIRGEHR